MSYRTSYSLEIRDHDGYDWISDLRDSCENAMFALEADGSTAEQCSWYEHDSDLKKFSSEAPGILFILTGAGEEAGDLWRKYYRDGNEQVAQAIITYDECGI